MADVVVFHHVQGLTEGVRHFADSLRAAGHTVTTPDLFEGASFASLDEGMAHVRSIGFESVMDRARGAVEHLPTGLVYVGFSLGVMPAQMLAQTREGAAGALLVDACVPVGEFSESWPAGVPVQIHGMDHDPFFAEEGDSRPRASSSPRPTRRSCSSIRATSTSSPTTASLRTTKPPRPC
jgi:dienelactone hydrolase